MKKLFYPFAFALTAFLILYSCSAEEEDTTPPPSVVAKYSVQIESSSGGSVNNAGGEFTKGTSITITATPNAEYVFSGWSNGSTENPITIEINSNLTLTANFEKRKYPLAINIEGEGTISEEIVNTGKTTDYDSGTTVRLTANPSEGWMFSSWGEGYDSDELTIDILIDEPKEINVIFSEVTLASLELKTKSKMFTKGVADTLLIPINIPAGFKNINVFAEDGSISVESKPEEGDTEGNIIIRYTNQVVNNVDWDRTIAGYDNIDFIIEDLENNSVEIEYKLRAQPEPIFRNYKAQQGKFTDGNESRAKLKLEVVEHLNRRTEMVTPCDFDESNSPIPIFNGETAEEMEDGILYFNSNFLARYNLSEDGFGSTYGTTLYPDLNGDGYEDLIFSNISVESNGCFGCQSLPLQFYFYEDGEYIYKEIEVLGSGNLNVKMGFWVHFTDLDNDGDPDFILQGGGDAQGSGEGISDEVRLLENNFNNSGNFILHPFELKGNQITDQNAFIDMNSDGLIDIVGNNGPYVYLNQGNFNFTRPTDNFENAKVFFELQDPIGTQNNFGTKNLYFNLNSSSIIADFDKDGIIDIYIPGIDGEQERQFENGEIPYFPNIPATKILYGSKGYRFLPELNKNIEVVRFTYDNLVEIPKVEGYEEAYSAKYKDIDNDGIEELIIERLHLEVNNQYTRQEGHYIQILEINGRVFTDVTSSYIEKNSASDSGVIFDGCTYDNRFRSHIRVDDTNGDGKMEIFALKNYLFTQDSKDHIWEWNGSKFIKISP